VVSTPAGKGKVQRTHSAKAAVTESALLQEPKPPALIYRAFLWRSSSALEQIENLLLVLAQLCHKCHSGITRTDHQLFALDRESSAPRFDPLNQFRRSVHTRTSTKLLVPGFSEFKGKPVLAGTSISSMFVPASGSFELLVPLFPL
jgi:hypothetical protein